MTKFIDVAQVQAGDELVLNKVRYAVEYIEPDGIAFDMQLQSEQGSRVRKCFTVGEMVTINL
jgi:hypothetical protein